jgi:hypothetical protein
MECFEMSQKVCQLVEDFAVCLIVQSKIWKSDFSADMFGLPKFKIHFLYSFFEIEVYFLALRGPGGYLELKKVLNVSHTELLDHPSSFKKIGKNQDEPNFTKCL